MPDQYFLLASWYSPVTSPGAESRGQPCPCGSVHIQSWSNIKKYGALHGLKISSFEVLFGQEFMWTKTQEKSGTLFESNSNTFILNVHVWTIGDIGVLKTYLNKISYIGFIEHTT